MLHLEKLVAVVRNAQEGVRLLDTLYWTKRYEVLSVSRLLLHDAGLTTEQCKLFDSMNETIYR